MLTPQKALVYTAWGCTVLGELFGLFCLAWTFSKRNSKVLKASQPTFLYLVAVGCMWSMSAIVPASLDHRGRQLEVYGYLHSFIYRSLSVYLSI